MSVQRPQHIETQDPKFFAFRRRTLTYWLVWSLFSIFATLALGNLGLILSLTILGGLLLDTIMQIYHRLQIEQQRHYWQTEALFSLFASVQINHPLPPMRLWAASPDYINYLIALIKKHQPQHIVEIGSGVSSIIGGYALQQHGDGGTLTTLEHEAFFASVTENNLRDHGVDDVVTVVHAPLKSMQVNGRDHHWYDLDCLPDLPPIDLLVVDGPPEGTQRFARYPALPLLYDRLSSGAYILVDDFLRNDEFEMVRRWVEDYGLKVIKTFPNEKGVAILQKL